MSTLSTEIWGYAGGFFLFIVLTPQVYKTWTSRNVTGISVLFLLFEFLASICFIVYGIQLKESGLPMVVSNASALLCTLALVVAKIKFSDEKNTDIDTPNEYNVLSN